MDKGIFQIIILIIGFVAVVRGYRRGLTGQICGLMGMAFGVVCCLIFTLPLSEFLKTIMPPLVSFPFPPFVYSILSSTLIYFIVFWVFRFLSSILNSAFKIFGLGMLNRLFGSAFCLLKYLIPLSIIFNLILCIKPDSALLDYSKADDGNLVQAVLMLAPNLLDCLSVDDLSHALQLLDAKKISFNFKSSNNVINLECCHRADNYKNKNDA